MQLRDVRKRRRKRRARRWSGQAGSQRKRATQGSTAGPWSAGARPSEEGSCAEVSCAESCHMGYHVGSSSSHRRWFQRLSASLLNCLACLTVWLACPSCLLVVVPALWSFQRPSRPRASAVGASATGASAVKASAGPFASALGSALAVAFVLPLCCLEISVLVSPQVNPVARKATSGAQRSPGVKRSGRREAGACKCE